MYTEQVMEHFTNPRNVGEIENADGVGEVGNAKCGDIMKIFLKIENGVITDVKFKTFGCGVKSFVLNKLADTYFISALCCVFASAGSHAKNH